MIIFGFKDSRCLWGPGVRDPITEDVVDGLLFDFGVYQQVHEDDERYNIRKESTWSASR